MKKSLLLTICMAFIALLCVSSVFAQSLIENKAIFFSAESAVTLSETTVYRGVADDCNPATNLAVEYSTDCTKAELTWDAPAKSRSVVLWDNTDINVPTSGNNGLISTYWAGNDNWVFSGDDFDADATWTIEKVYTEGFSNAPSILPLKMAIVIYEDGGNKPGTEIYREVAITVTSGSEPEIVLPTPFTLPAPGKYWIAIAGAYDASVPPSALGNYRWNIYYGMTNIGSGFCLHDPSNQFGAGTNWMQAGPLLGDGGCSMFFKIEGTTDGPPPAAKYNVYRDGVKLTATPITETNYTDNAFDATAEHKWEVKVVCPDGESNPVEKTLPACDISSPCDKITNGAVAFDENTATLTWTAVAGAVKYKVTRGETTEEVTEPTYTEEGEFIAGTEYVWKVVTVCEDGESDPVDVKGTPVGIKDHELAAFSMLPNPAHNDITIKAGVVFHKVEVINFLGQTVISQPNDAKIVTLDVSNLTNGVYFVRIASEKGTSVKKFVKQ